MEAKSPPADFPNDPPAEAPPSAVKFVIDDVTTKEGSNEHLSRYWPSGFDTYGDKQK